MNILSIILQAQEVVANEAAEVIANPAVQDAARNVDQTARTQNGWMTWVMLIGIFAIMYFFMIRPQKKAQKEQQNFLNSIQRGTKVVTAGGIFGVVEEVRENILLIEVDKGVVIRVAKSSVQKDPSEPAPAPASK